ncbi:hypothetical protein PS3A_13070 [Pseudomonas sp. 3A(2025)]
MQTEHFIAVGCLILGFSLLTLFIRRALTRAFSDGYNQGKAAAAAGHDQALVDLGVVLGSHYSEKTQQFQDVITTKNQIISHLTDQLHTSEACALSKADLKVLTNVATTLDLACRTWAPIRGTEPHQARAKQQLQQIKDIGNRVLAGLSKVQAAPTQELING